MDTSSPQGAALAGRRRRDHSRGARRDLLPRAPPGLMRALAAALAVGLGSASSALPGARDYAADQDVMRCEERADLPRIEHVTVAKWCPDGRRLAAPRITSVPDPTNIT